MDNILRKKGSYTIELSLLMPILLVVLLLIIYSDFYMHDRVVIGRACYAASLRASLCINENERESLARREFLKEIENKLLGKWKYSFETTLENDEVVANFEGTMLSSQGLLNKTIGSKLFEFSVNSKSKLANETRYLRNYTKGK